ncbi:hypothetical protein ACJW30_08G123400 [Castanea mollissima]
MESENQKVISEAEELPRTIVRRVVKDKLSHDGDDMSVHKDALLAFSESARIFIHYLSATANDICKESKRQTINADDVLTALQEIEFSHFLGPLKASLHGLVAWVSWANHDLSRGRVKKVVTKIVNCCDTSIL